MLDNHLFEKLGHSDKLPPNYFVNEIIKYILENPTLKIMGLIPDEIIIKTNILKWLFNSRELMKSYEFNYLIAIIGQKSNMDIKKMVVHNCSKEHISLMLHNISNQFESNEIQKLIITKNKKISNAFEYIPEYKINIELIDFIIDKQFNYNDILRFIPSNLLSTEIVKKIILNCCDIDFFKILSGRIIPKKLITDEILKIMIDKSVPCDVIIKYAPVNAITDEILKLFINSGISCNVIIKYTPPEAITDEILKLFINSGISYDILMEHVPKKLIDNQFVKSAIKNRIRCHILTKYIPKELVNEEIITLMVNMCETTDDCNVLINFFSKELINDKIVEELVRKKKVLISKDPFYNMLQNGSSLKRIKFSDKTPWNEMTFASAAQSSSLRRIPKGGFYNQDSISIKHEQMQVNMPLKETQKSIK